MQSLLYSCHANALIYRIFCFLIIYSNLPPFPLLCKGRLNHFFPFFSNYSRTFSHFLMRNSKNMVCFCFFFFEIYFSPAASISPNRAKIGLSPEDRRLLVLNYCCSADCTTFALNRYFNRNNIRVWRKPITDSVWIIAATMRSIYSLCVLIFEYIIIL